jgi:predicted metal-dependent phosphoesterase TrpH
VPPPGFAAFDLHVHTRFSPDSTAEPEAMLRAAALRGLAGIAVTDHNTVAGAERTRAVAALLRAHGELPAGFQVIEGEEVGSRDGHVVGLFLHATVPPGMSAEATIAAIHAQGGLAVAAHPCLRSGVGRRAASLPFDAVETENIAEELHYSFGSAAANGRRAAFYRTIAAARVGSSDAHDPSVVGLGYTLVPTAAPDKAALRQALTTGATRAAMLAPARHLQRVAESTARPASAALRGFHRLLAPGSRALRGMTRADSASLGPNVSHGRLGWALRLMKRL